MKRFLYWLVGTAIVLNAAPAAAGHAPKINGKAVVCAEWRGGYCVAAYKAKVKPLKYKAVEYKPLKYKALKYKPAKFHVGYVLGPSYGYTPYPALPARYVSRYDLNPRYRYVYRNGAIYVVDPQSYAIERVISALAR